jgi:hypothetical protein
VHDSLLDWVEASQDTFDLDLMVARFRLISGLQARFQALRARNSATMLLNCISRARRPASSSAGVVFESFASEGDEPIGVVTASKDRRSPTSASLAGIL